MIRTALLLSAALLAACAPVSVDEAQQGIVGGTETTDFPSVVMTIAHVPNALYSSLCSGIVASPHVILTAAHCVAPSTVGSGADYLYFTGGDPATNSGIAVSETHFDPKFDSTKLPSGHDVGALVLTDAFVGTPMLLNRTLIGSALEGQAAQLVGYGITGPGATSTAGHKRELDSTLVDYSDHLVEFGMEGATPCDGDSGGPAIMQINGQTVVVGLVSYGNTECTDAVSYDRVDDYLSFMDGIIETADPGFLTDTSEPHRGCSVTPGQPAPAPWIFAIAFLALALRQYRKSRA